MDEVMIITVRVPNGPRSIPEAQKWPEDHGIDASALKAIEIPDAAIS